MDAETLHRAAQAAREFQAQIGPRSVTLRRPGKAAIPEFFAGTIGKKATLASQRAAVWTSAQGWSGFTEADFIPGGGTDPAPFSQTLLDMWLEDHPEESGILFQALAEKCMQYLNESGAAAKN